MSWGKRSLAFSRLLLLLERSRCQGMSPEPGFTHLDPQQAGQHLSGTTKGHPTGYMRQMLLHIGGQTARQQHEFLIEGEKAPSHTSDRFRRYVRG